MLGIMAVMDQEDFYMLVVGPGSGMCTGGRYWIVRYSWLEY